MSIVKLIFKITLDPGTGAIAHHPPYLLRVNKTIQVLNLLLSRNDKIQMAENMKAARQYV